MRVVIFAFVLVMFPVLSFAGTFGFIPEPVKGTKHQYANQQGFTTSGNSLSIPLVNITSSDTSAILTWDEVDGADSYNIYWSLDPNKPKANKYDNGKNTSFAHNDLKVDTYYYYAVVPIDSKGVEGKAYQFSIKTAMTTEEKNLLSSAGAKITAAVPKVTLDLANYCIAFADKNGEIAKDHCYPLTLKTTQQVKSSLSKVNFADSLYDEDGGVGNIKFGWRKQLYSYKDDSQSGINIELNGGIKFVEGLTGKSANDTSIYSVGQGTLKLYTSFPIFDTSKPITIKNKAGALSVGFSAIGNYANSSIYKQTFNDPSTFTGHIEGSAQIYITNVINLQAGGTIANTTKNVDNRYFFVFSVER